MAGKQRRHVHLTHWGAAEIESDGRTLTSVRPWREDPAPSRILENLAAAHRHPARVDQPYIREGWLEHGPDAATRGSDVFVPVSELANILLLVQEKEPWILPLPESCFSVLHELLISVVLETSKAPLTSLSWGKPIL